MAHSNMACAIPLIYPWEMLKDWWVNAESQPSELVRRPSFTRAPSFSLSDDGLHRNASNTQVEHLAHSPDLDKARGHKESTQTNPHPQTIYPSARQNKVLQEINAQDDFLWKNHGLQRFLIVPDGNCLYRAVAQALVHDQSKHMVLRREVVQHIQNNIDDFKDIIEGDAWEFLKAASRDSTWASYTEILAITQMLDINITIVTGGTSDNDKVHVTLHHFHPAGGKITPKDTVWLSWLSNGHYDLIVDHKMENIHYDEWVKETTQRMKQDEKLAQHIALEETGGVLSGITGCIKHLVSKKATSDSSTSSNKTTNINNHWNINNDQQLALSLQQEEDRAFEDKFGDDYA
uniref:OTU domain-containing protein 1 n=1 Tax=Phallusia mammillata TaxID=59560 RepID=A0A6F9DN35_9ASCI|nr:OTU domain-containing protein 5 [Phallusia mammillata]